MVAFHARSSKKSISTAGPSIVVAYLVIGAMLFFVMRAMGELLLAVKWSASARQDPEASNAQHQPATADGVKLWRR